MFACFILGFIVWKACKQNDFWEMKIVPALNCMKTQKQASFKCLQVDVELVDSWEISQQWCKVDKLKRRFYGSWIFYF